MINNYCPPQELHDKQIWTLGLAGPNTRGGKLSEYNASKKKMPLLSWPGVVKRFNKNPKQYSGIVGIVSPNIATIDVDKKEIPQNIQRLLEQHPTFSHPSFSGNGHHIYYHSPEAISGGKKMRKFKEDDELQGEVIQGMFVTTSAFEPQDFSSQKITEITRKQLAEFIPEVDKELLPSKIAQQAAPDAYKYLDPDKLKREAAAILHKLPVDPDHLVQITFETKLTDAEFSPYNYWLTVAQGLVHLSIQLTQADSTITEHFANLFHEWSQKGQSYKGREDCDEKFYHCVESSLTQTGLQVTFDTLRKIAHNYRIPLSEFTKLRFDKKGKITGVDNTDPRNYKNVIDRMQIRLVQSSSNTFVTGPASVIKHYFSNKRPNFLTDNDDTMSLPFLFKFRTDDDLINRLIILYREMGIEGVVRSNPMFAGFQSEGVDEVDLVYNWMASVPWDKRPRIKEMVEKSLDIDITVAEEAGVPVEFYHHMALKHLIHMAGLRAKSYRYSTGQEKAGDSHKKTQGALIICGYQKKGKTTWIESLMPFRAQASLSVTAAAVKDTLEMQRALTNTFVYNIDEIDVIFDRMDPSEFKSVITQDKDSFRTMYSQSVDSHLRRSGFFGTTNSKRLRLDKTGNRRIWLIPTINCDANYFFNCNYQQVWAELLHMAEKLTGDNWAITFKEDSLINKTANLYMKQSVGTRMLDMQLSSEDEEGKAIDLLYCSDEMDFSYFFTELKQMCWRELNGQCFFALRGQRAYKHLQSSSLFNEDIKFSLKSFSYEIAEFCDTLFNFQNQTLTLGKHVYRDGVIHIYTGKPAKTQFHFLPYKEHIDKFIAKGFIDACVLFANREE